MFANGSYVTVWEVKRVEDNYADVQISTSRKVNGSYEQDFGAIVRFVGEAKNVVVNKKAKEKVRIIECAVSNKYNKEKKVTYWNPVVFKCEDVNGGAKQTKPVTETTDDDSVDMNAELPF